MELLASENQLQLVVSESAKSLPDLLYSQRELFRSQIDELENIVLTQCKLTGVNPLSQEMAAGALSIKIGKRPRDLLNPKAIKYMQSIFSIKDAISKKETREISALFGVTATQVRDFFNSQRSRVRKFIRLSREKADRSISSKQMQEQQGELPVNIDPNEPLNPVPLDSVAPISIEEAPTCSKEDEALPAIDESDKHFVENIFSLMRKEETFSGQVKLMEWILQIQNSSVLFWFLTKGGIMILATWLSQAVVEEQTSVLNVILKVLCHLPLQKALPVHMSAVLQSVNRLRFYRASDISNRARILLSRWSKAFARSQALKKKNGTKSANDTQDEMLLKQSINEVMGNGSWDSKIDLIEDGSTTLDEISGNIRKLESQPLKLLTASPDDTNKKLISGVRSSQSRERRKVLLVEQPCQKSAGRSSQVGRPTATQGRPLSADDIQKAKMRAQFMQSKYGKTNITSSESSPLQLEAANKSNSPQMSILQSVPKADIGHVIEEPKKSENPPSKISYLQDPSIANKMISNSDEPPQKKCKRVQIPWQTPPEMVLNVSWRVGTGESSKEVEVQKHRIHRERETIYKAVQEIPSDPREPWDREMDYDDSLTPEIPTDQLPDADGGAAEASTCTRENEGTTTASTSSQQINGGNQPEPDMELLAVLLKNPELVFALTSVHAGNLSSEETVKLLDMIKANGIGLSSSASTSSSGSLSVLGANGKAEEKVEVSLPSPTPSCNPVTNGWKADLARNPFSREAMMNNHEMDAAAAAHYQQNIAATSLMQQPLHVRPTGTLAALAVAEHSASSVLHSQPQILPTAIPSHSQSVLGLHQNAHAAYAAFPMQASELELKTRTNLAAPAIMQVEATGIVNPSRSSYATESSSRPTRQIPHYQQNNFNSFAGGGQYMRGGRGGGWERNELLGDEQDFESWSPPPHGSHSNSRYNNNSINQQGWNYPESTSTSSRVNPSSSYSYNRSRNPSGYHPNHPPGKSGGGIKRWNH